jgi:hypothetical protein
MFARSPDHLTRGAINSGHFESHPLPLHCHSSCLDSLLLLPLPFASLSISSFILPSVKSENCLLGGCEELLSFYPLGSIVRASSRALWFIGSDLRSRTRLSVPGVSTGSPVRVPDVEDRIRLDQSRVDSDLRFRSPQEHSGVPRRVPSLFEPRCRGPNQVVSLPCLHADRWNRAHTPKTSQS